MPNTQPLAIAYEEALKDAVQCMRKQPVEKMGCKLVWGRDEIRMSGPNSTGHICVTKHTLVPRLAIHWQTFLTRVHS